ncbi:MAG TPA: hypothetical protein VHX59_22230 [Mycobacteriales bacterium]|nr:hypothetical protein [Mycobacteriales bacterium]
MGSEGVVLQQLEFVSDFWLNLHHVLYAAAWDGRPSGRPVRRPAGALPEPLDGPLTQAERADWELAVGYYDEHLADRHLLFGDGMRALNAALVAGDLAGEVRAVLQSAAPVYRRHFWPGHDAANRQWVSELMPRLSDLGPHIFTRLAGLYGESWFTEPVRVDIVRVASREGAYTTAGPPHITISSSDRDGQGWVSVEVVLHESSHIFGGGLRREFAHVLGSAAPHHPQLWHAVLFYLAGGVTREALAGKGIDYVPYLYATGLLERAWPSYREPVESCWQPFLDGTINRGEALARTVDVLRTR